MVSKSDYTIIQSVIDVLGFLLLTVIIIIQHTIKALLPSSYRNHKDISGQVVLVTGGGGGLGRLIALRLAKLKAKVVLWDINLDGVQETIKQVQDLGAKAYGYKCNLADREDVYRVAKETVKDVGDVNILINNAGVLSGNFLLDTPDHMIQRTFEVNILAHFWTTKAFLPQMMAKNNGHIVTIASMAGYTGVSKLIDYCSSKYAAVGFDEALRVELEDQGYKGVKTTAICPYFIQATGMFNNVNSRFFPTLKLSTVADRIILAIQREETSVMIPGSFRLGIMFKIIMPWPIVSIFLRNVIPDAVPHGESTPTEPKKNVPVNNNVNSVRTVQKPVAVDEKND